MGARAFRGAHERQDWDEVAATPEQIAELRRVSKQQIIWGGNYFDLPPSQGFLIWNKLQPETFSSAMCEFAWMSEAKPAKMFSLHPASYEKFHPTQKPVELMEWCIRQAGMPYTALDPFCGAGTTCVAAVRLGRHFLGFERLEEFCRISRERIALAQKQSTLFESVQNAQLNLGR